MPYFFVYICPMVNILKVSMFCFVGLILAACTSHNEGKAIINIHALAAFPSDSSVSTLAKSREYLDVELPDNARLEEMSAADLSVLKAAAYRFFAEVKSENGQYIINQAGLKNLHLSDKLTAAYVKSIDNLNHFADSLKKEGQEIRLPEITDTYREALLN